MNIRYSRLRIFYSIHLELFCSKFSANILASSPATANFIDALPSSSHASPVLLQFQVTAQQSKSSSPSHLRDSPNCTKFSLQDISQTRSASSRDSSSSDISSPTRPQSLAWRSISPVTSLVSSPTRSTKLADNKMAYPQEPTPHFPVFPYNPEIAYGPAMMMGHDRANAMAPMPPLPQTMGPMGSMAYSLIPPPGAYPSPPHDLFKVPPPPGFHSPPLPSLRFQSPSHALAYSLMPAGPLPLPVQLKVDPAPFNIGPLSLSEENKRPREPVYRDEARRLSITNLVLEPVENCNNTVKVDVISGGKFQVSTRTPKLMSPSYSHTSN